MAIELHIDDGSPYWYLSPNIWVVPSDDPNDPPGVPFVNVSAYVWARVRNNGTTPVSNATVRYYWANPATIIGDTTATLIGSSSVSLAPSETRDVLCVTPWLPQWVNDGHECLIAEAFASSSPGNPFVGPDPLPPRAPGDAYQVIAWRQMAQKNLDIVRVEPSMMMVHPFLIGNPAKDEDGVFVMVRREPIEALKEVIATMGLRDLPEEADGFDEFGIQPFRCGDQIQETGRQEFSLGLPGRHQQGMALVARAPRTLHENAGALFLIEQIGRDQEVLGGVGVLVLGTQRQ